MVLVALVKIAVASQHKRQRKNLCQDLLRNENTDFTIIAEIHARSLANFYCQYADRHMNLKFMRRVSEREPAIRQFIIVKKQIDVSY